MLNEHKSNKVVSLWYRAPELLLKMPYNYKIDIWSLGCIYYELIHKQVLFKGKDEHDQLNLIYNRPQLNDNLLINMLKLSTFRIDTNQILHTIH